MLIKCPECGRENISDQAINCPNCGRPIKATTIEATGKKWKTVQLLSGIAFIIGIVLLIVSVGGRFPSGIALLLLLGSLVTFLGARIGAWWHHG